MVAVFVHGNPETPVIWDPLLDELERTDVAALQLPGFGVAAPVGFGATKEEYVDWLIGELSPLVAGSGPVDLVGHDWGGGFALRVAALRPDLLRSWASDVPGLFHPDYQWHDFAKIWQTPGDGEQYFEQTMAMPVADRVAMYESIGIPRAQGEPLVAAADEEMSRCILALYRSAAQPAMVAWGRDLRGTTTRPGLALIATEDPFVKGDTLGAEMAEQMGARVHRFVGEGHWWMLGAPAAGARTLTEFWASIDG